MPKFRFAATDTEGMLHDGTIDAPSAAMARARLEANGLSVREVAEVEPPAGEPPPFSGPPPTYVSPRLVPDVPRRSPSIAARSSRRRATVFLALFALMVALFSIGYSLSRNPVGGRLSRYDFSSPEAALRSQVKMRARGDFQAEMEYQIRMRRTELRQAADSMEIIRTADFEDKKILFVSFTVVDSETGNERTMKHAEWFEKDPESGYWVLVGEKPPGWQHTDKKLAQEIAEWQGHAH